MSNQRYKSGYITWIALVNLELKISMLMNHSGKDITGDTILETQNYSEENFEKIFYEISCYIF
jgi:hypothetical protein